MIHCKALFLDLIKVVETVHARITTIYCLQKFVTRCRSSTSECGSGTAWLTELTADIMATLQDSLVYGYFGHENRVYGA